MIKTFTPRDDRDILRMVEQGFTDTQIARHFGCTSNRVSKRRRKLTSKQDGQKVQSRRKKPCRSQAAKPRLHRLHMGRVAMMPCAVASHECSGRVEVNHVYARNHPTMNMKDDRHVMPLCSHHHRTGKNAYHDMTRQAFNQMYGIDCFELAEGLWKETEGITPKP